METQRMCFNAFPKECIGCAEYNETGVEAATQLASILAGGGMAYPLQQSRKIVKECRRYHKQKIEYLR